MDLDICYFSLFKNCNAVNFFHERIISKCLNFNFDDFCPFPDGSFSKGFQPRVSVRFDRSMSWLLNRCEFSFKFNTRKVLISIQPKSKPRPPLNHKVILNQDLRTFLQRPTNTKVVKVWNRNCLCFLGDLICLFITVSYVFLLQRSLMQSPKLMIFPSSPFAPTPHSSDF